MTTIGEEYNTWIIVAIWIGFWLGLILFLFKRFVFDRKLEKQQRGRE